MRDEAWFQEIHRRVCAGDVTAPSELAHEVLDRLVNTLQIRYVDWGDSNLLIDAVTDAFMSYVKRPAQ